MNTSDSFDTGGGFEAIAGMRFRIKGIRGQWNFRYASTAADGAVSLTFVGGPKHHFRSFRPDQVVWPQQRKPRRARTIQVDPIHQSGAIPGGDDADRERPRRRVRARA